MPDLSPAETLRAAAVRLRDRAARATKGPWSYLSDSYRVVAPDGQVASQRDYKSPLMDGDGEWIAALNPAVAEPIAREMEMHATWIDLVRTDPLRHARAIGCAEYMLALARSILEQP